jgi:hypothetical protein
MSARRHSGVAAQASTHRATDYFLKVKQCPMQKTSRTVGLNDISSGSSKTLAEHRGVRFARATLDITFTTSLVPGPEWARVPNLGGRHMSHVFKLNQDVHHQPQGPQGRSAINPPIIYTVVQRMPIEADGRLRYRIKSKSENIERIVTEDQLSYSQ